MVKSKKVTLGIHSDMKTKQEKLYFQYDIHIPSPTNFFKFTVFHLKVEGLKLWFKDNIRRSP